MMSISVKHQQGFLSIAAVLLIVVLGLLGVTATYLVTTELRSGIEQLRANQALYLAESGLEGALHILSQPDLSGNSIPYTCAGLAATSGITTTLALGTLNGLVNLVFSGPYAAQANLSGSISATATTIPLTTTANFTVPGRVMIDGEMINVAAMSGNNLIAAVRGVDKTQPASHANSAKVSQYQCNIQSQGSVPSTNPLGRRTLQQAMVLTSGWLVSNSGGPGKVKQKAASWNNPEAIWSTDNLLGLTDTWMNGHDANNTNLNAVAMLNPSDVWVVGDSGVVGHFDGSSWSTPKSVSNGVNLGTQNLNAVAAVSSQEAWVAGANGVLAKWNGSNWWLQSTGSTQPLNGLAMLDTTGNGLADIGWAVGNSATVLRYTGSAWVSDGGRPGGYTYYTVAALANETWIGGNAGVIFKRMSNGAWSKRLSPLSVSQPINSISVIDTNGDGLADVGWAVGPNRTVLYYTGNAWVIPSDASLANISTSANLTAVYTLSPYDAWIGDSNGLLYKWDGSSWVRLANSLNRSINGIAMIGSHGQPYSGWKEVFS